jgi:heme/copper-type cytochrome/quinol oxidase subunit 3
MLVAMISGTVFVGLQSFGLWCLMQNQLPKNAETGQNAFVFVFAAMHGIHFIVALLFLIFVTLHALNDRYDHEYFWGVTVCKYFWHCLGVVWCAILGVIAIGM